MGPTHELDAARCDATLRERVRTHLDNFDRQRRPEADLTAAAISVVICEDADGQACFLITRRSSRLRDHAGQWAFPGGRVDHGETVAEAALRELSEEVGLELGESSILGFLDDYSTRSGFVISPAVVWGGPAAALAPNPDEVAAVYHVPLVALNDPAIPRISRIPESDRPIIGVPILDTVINAPTAAILFQFREVALHGRDTRVSHYDQPRFAWK